MKIQLRKPGAIFLLAYVASSGCTWVDPIPGASSVTLVQPAHVSIASRLVLPHPR